MDRDVMQKPVVLLIDDTEADLDLLVETLQQDYEVAVAMDGQSALQAVAETTPDLVLLDVMMPLMDGYEVCRRLKADPDTADIPVIFLTAKSDVTDETRGLELGAVDYITKPISPPIVRARLRTHLALRQAFLDLAWQHQELIKLSRLRDEVERMSRHDLKTPLTAVINIPDLLLTELKLTSDQRELLLALKQSGYRMLQIINSSLDLYKMETGRYRYTPTPVNLAPLLDQILRELGDLMMAKSLRARLLLEGRPLVPGQCFWVSGEETVIYTMLANLIKNAVEASPPEREITIRLAAGDQAVVEIHNQGAVPKQIRDCFFDKFTTDGKQGGTGLGTYTARLIAQTLGGSITFSTSDQAGTTLTIRLALAPDQPAAAGADTATEVPAAAFSAPPLSPGLAADQGARGIRILVVDDYASMRCLTQSILHGLGYGPVLEAADGESALAIIANQPVDLIISDLHMPKMSGLELLRAVRANPDFQELPFIIASGEADKKIIDEATTARASEYLLKPFSPDAVKASVERLLFRSGVGRRRD